MALCLYFTQLHFSVNFWFPQLSVVSVKCLKCTYLKVHGPARAEAQLGLQEKLLISERSVQIWNMFLIM